jgi:ketosteroid isomerase-like protein
MSTTTMGYKPSKPSRQPKKVLDGLNEVIKPLEDLYLDLHSRPELDFHGVEAGPLDHGRPSKRATELKRKRATIMTVAVTDVRSDRAALFAKLETPETQPQFWARVADDVDWTVEGTHPLAGRYHDKKTFIKATFTRLDGVLPGGVKLVLEHLYVDGDTTIAELLSTSKTKEGAAFANRYCWVCRFAGGIIVEVRAYLDSTMVAYTILRNENLIAD